MAPPKKDVKRVPLSLRLPQAVVNESRAIPNFRGKLELFAIGLFEEWVKEKERGV